MKNMRNTCRVLLALADSGKQMTSQEIADVTELTPEQVSTAVNRLVIKQKVNRVELIPSSANTKGYRYEYNQNQPLPDVVGNRGKPSKCTVREHVRPATRFVPSKVAMLRLGLLERLRDKVGGDDIDILIGMINEYREMCRRPTDECDSIHAA